MTDAVQGLQSGCHAWDENGRSGRFRLSGGVIRELQLNGYDASPIHPKLGISALTMDIGKALASSLGNRLGDGSFRFEHPSEVQRRSGATNDWDEALPIFALQLWCPSSQHGCDRPTCLGCGSKLENKGNIPNQCHCFQRAGRL